MAIHLEEYKTGLPSHIMLKINSGWIKDLNVKNTRKPGRVCGHSQGKAEEPTLNLYKKRKKLNDVGKR